MKTEGAIRKKLNQVCFRHRKKLLEKNLHPAPSNCVYNDFPEYPEETSETQRVPQYKVCFYDGPEDWGGFVCDEEVGGNKLARRCPCFAAKRTPEGIKEEFQEFLKGDVGAIAEKYPDVVALMWVLGLTPGDTDLLEFWDEQELPADHVSGTESGEGEEEDQPAYNG